MGKFLRLADAERMRNELECALSWKLRPELIANRGSRVYVVLASEVRSTRFGGEWLGATAPGMLGWLRSSIDDRRWCGPGPAMLLNDHLLGWDDFGAIAVHEAAHILTRSSLFVTDRSTTATASAENHSVRMLTQAAGVLANPSAANEGHNGDFIRAMFHLREWLMECGWRIPVDSLLVWQHFTGRDGGEFLTAIGDEPDLLRGLPVSHILKTQPPAEFSAVCAGSMVGLAMSKRFN